MENRNRIRQNGITAFASYVLAPMNSQPAKDIFPQDKLRFTAFNFRMRKKQTVKQNTKHLPWILYFSIIKLRKCYNKRNLFLLYPLSSPKFGFCQRCLFQWQIISMRTLRKTDTLLFFGYKTDTLEIRKQSLDYLSVATTNKKKSEVCSNMLGTSISYCHNKLSLLC